MHALRRLTAPSLHPLWLLAVSGAAGFRIGYVAFPTWHVALQSAQVVAGIVRYPPDNPFYIYHTKLWTLLHQLLAPLLLAGVSERQLSLFLSGLLGMLAFQALALVVYALSRDLLLSLGAALLIFYVRATAYGVAYPVFLMGTEHTYGAIGLSLAVLAIGLFGSGCWRLGGLLLGVLPAVHPSIGAGLWIAAAAVALSVVRQWSQELRRALPYFAAGAALTIASLVVQMAVIYDVPAVDPEVTREYMLAFTAFFDVHRQPVSAARPGVIFNFASLALAIIWLRSRGEQLTAGPSVVLRFVVANAIVGIACMLLSWVPPESLPPALVTFMPARLLNTNVMTFAALLIGLLGSLRHHLAAAVALPLLTFGLLFSQPSMIWSGGGIAWWPFSGRPDQVAILEATAICTAVIGLVLWGRETAPTGSFSRSSIASGPLRIAALAAMAFVTMESWKLESRSVLHDRTNEPVFAIASQESNGLVAASGVFHLAQLLTRRPTLLNAGALDTLSYAPEGAVAMNSILRDVYGIDLLNPPSGMPRGSDLIPDDFNRRVWEGFSRETWTALRRRHQVTQVLTTNYDLQLPVIAQSREFRLYGVPEE